MRESQSCLLSAVQWCWQGRDSLPSLLPLTPETSRKVGLNGVVRAGELSLALTCCSTRENRLCTSPGQYIRTDSDGRVAGVPALKV